MQTLQIARWTNLALMAGVAIGLHASQTLAQQVPITQPTDPSISSPGCISGTPDGTFQGDRPVTRNEFAVGTNTCLNQVEQSLPQRRSELATKKDFEVLIQRQRELNAEIRELNQRLAPAPKLSP